VFHTSPPAHTQLPERESSKGETMKVVRLTDNELDIMRSFTKERDEAQRVFKDAQDKLHRVCLQIDDYQRSLERTHQIRSARIDDDKIHLVGYSQAEWNAMNPEAAQRANR
jgi:hypothetical protein